MRKLAIFVEGYTEIEFVKNLIKELAGENNVVIEHQKIRGGTTVPRSVTTITAAKTNTGQKYFVLLVDCEGDRQVKTRIVEEHENLTANGYSKVIGLRDVRPEFTHAEIPKLELGLRYGIKTSLIPVEFVLATMEIEAWFLAEHTHYERINPSLTIEKINGLLAFDVVTDDTTLRLTPANDLENIYKMAGRTYEKGNANFTISVLDYPFMYLELTEKIPQLKLLACSLDTFLA